MFKAILNIVQTYLLLIVGLGALVFALVDQRAVNIQFVLMGIGGVLVALGIIAMSPDYVKNNLPKGK